MRSPLSCGPPFPGIPGQGACRDSLFHQLEGQPMEQCPTHITKEHESRVEHLVCLCMLKTLLCLNVKCLIAHQCGHRVHNPFCIRCHLGELPSSLVRSATLLGQFSSSSNWYVSMLCTRRVEGTFLCTSPVGIICQGHVMLS